MVAYRVGRVPHYYVISLVNSNRASASTLPLKRFRTPSSIG